MALLGYGRGHDVEPRIDGFDKHVLLNCGSTNATASLEKRKVDLRSARDRQTQPLARSLARSKA